MSKNTDIDIFKDQSQKSRKTSKIRKNKDFIRNNIENVSSFGETCKSRKASVAEKSINRTEHRHNASHITINRRNTLKVSKLTKYSKNSRKKSKNSHMASEADALKNVTNIRPTSRYKLSYNEPKADSKMSGTNVFEVNCTEISDTTQSFINNLKYNKHSSKLF